MLCYPLAVPTRTLHTGYAAVTAAAAAAARMSCRFPNISSLKNHTAPASTNLRGTRGGWTNVNTNCGDRGGDSETSVNFTCARQHTSSTLLGRRVLHTDEKHIKISWRSVKGSSAPPGAERKLFTSPLGPCLERSTFDARAKTWPLTGHLLCQGPHPFLKTPCLLAL